MTTCTDVSMRQNDVLPVLQVTLQGAGPTVVDLSTATGVRFHMTTPNGTVIVDAPATIVNAAEGKVQYEWTAADTADYGVFTGEFEVTFPSGTETFPNDDDRFLIRITKQLA